MNAASMKVKRRPLKINFFSGKLLLAARLTAKEIILKTFFGKLIFLSLSL
jgi:hypothetical protein